MGALPIPDSLEKTARFTPAIIDPKTPPVVASKLNALWKTLNNASGICSKLDKIINKHDTT